LTEASAGLVEGGVEYSEEELSAILSPRHFVEVRRTWGGPAPEETRRAAAASREALAKDEVWWKAAREGLVAAARELRETAERI
jgi:hypothetical protein